MIKFYCAFGNKQISIDKITIDLQKQMIINKHNLGMKIIYEKYKYKSV